MSLFEHLPFPRLIQEIAIQLQIAVHDTIDDACCFQWDGIDVNLYHYCEEPQNYLIFSLKISALPQQPKAAQQTLMLCLNGNFLWAGTQFATLSVNSSDNHIYLCDKLCADQAYNSDASPQANLKSIVTHLEKLHQCALNWKMLIQEQCDIPSAPESGDSQESQSASNNYALKI